MGMQQVNVDPAELMTIDYLFDMAGDSIFAPTVGSSQNQEKSRLAEIKDLFGYANGGIIDPNDPEELYQILEMIRNK